MNWGRGCAGVGSCLRRNDGREGRRNDVGGCGSARDERERALTLNKRATLVKDPS